MVLFYEQKMFESIEYQAKLCFKIMLAAKEEQKNYLLIVQGIVYEARAHCRSKVRSL